MKRGNLFLKDPLEEREFRTEKSKDFLSFLVGMLSFPFLEEEITTNFPQVVAVYSPKGGVGKTHISVNLATLLAGTKQPTVFLDADIEFGGSRRLWGIPLSYEFPDMLDLIRDFPDSSLFNIKELNNYLITNKYTNVKVLLGPAVPEVVRIHKYRDIWDIYKPLLEILRNSFRYIVIDCGMSLSSPLTQLGLIQAQRILMIADLDIGTLQNVHLAINSLKRTGGFNKKTDICINKYPKNPEEEALVKVSEVVSFFNKEVRSVVGFIPYVPEILKCTNLGFPYILFPDKEYRKEFLEMVSNMATGE